MNKYGIENTHRVLYERLQEYILSQYFGSSTLLQNAVGDELKKEGVLYQEPYIEANKSYKKSIDGINHAKKIPEHVKKFLGMLIENNLGVFKDPFSHQIEALEEFFDEKNILIATGTGSGKTECFMWPMISSIADEIYNRPHTWEIRGVRALFLYPMNALVSDQVGRLRRIIGDTSGSFSSVVRKFSSNNDIRVPQFGMYTGRTPYSGDKTDKEDQALAKSFRKNIIEADEDIKNELKRLGKYPAKEDFEAFVDGLLRGEHKTSKNDAELITRFEMLSNCPDILITNYSMLEYMLLRRREDIVWQKTKEWLNADVANKLLFVIDEAHMYKGSSGGEVALLIKRFMYKLGIDNNRIRFILTSASVPDDTESREKVKKFANDLTSSKPEDDKYTLIVGEQESLPVCESFVLDPKCLSGISIDNLQNEVSIKLAEINLFCEKVFSKKEPFSNEDDANLWLYNNLMKIEQCRQLLVICRGNSVSFEQLVKKIFPLAELAYAKQATQVLLSVANLAKDKTGNVLFPARLHLFFSGIEGVFACINPKCHNSNTYNGTTIGKVYLEYTKDYCDCGGRIYELINHRRCGGLFIKGFINTNAHAKTFIWPNIGILKSDTIKEIHLFLADGVSKTTQYLDSRTGLLLSNKKTDFCIPVDMPNTEKQEDEQLLTFSTCPKCLTKAGKKRITDFKTKGNIPFYNIISAQLLAQPATIFDEDKLKRFPNAGRKVLMFSDSRQTAAVLARDMTRAADDNAARQALVKAVIRLQKDKHTEKRYKTIDMLYTLFLQIVCEDNIQFFYGDDKELFEKHLQIMQNKIDEATERNRPLRYDRCISHFKSKPDLYNQQLLKLVCDNYQSLSDIALCWIECADDQDFDDIIYEINKNNISLSEEDLKILISNWCISVAKDSIALGDEIEDSVRESVQRNDYGRFGIEENKVFPKELKKLLNKVYGLNKEQISILEQIFSNNLTARNSDSKNSFLMTGRLALRYNRQHIWYKCEKCSGITAHSMRGYCPDCGRQELRPMTDQDYEMLSFWRTPVNNVLYFGEQIKAINTEEHTAQLSHKDQRKETWSTTENYEMRFQDVTFDQKVPVDALSCTTTMEVGIDIGSLSAVALRNIPPMRENYQQRAGRAGRRNSSISTICTYANEAPHDNWYFKNPKEIISGKLRKPWVDVLSDKLIRRHLHIVIFNEFFYSVGMSLDNCITVEFFKQHKDNFFRYLSKYEFSECQIKTLLPEGKTINYRRLTNELEIALLKIEEDVENHPEKYDIENADKVTMLDTLFDAGLLPTYSFPKNVVGFYIENSKGEIEQKPDRALDLAISEYAPGRTIVVNKKTYKSGGIYAHVARFRKGAPGTFKYPAEAYFNDKNYFMELYSCSNNECEWFGRNCPANGICPFCGAQITNKRHMLKPWGFAPEGGKSAKEAEPDMEFSQAGNPCYSATPEEDLKDTNYCNLKQANRFDQELTIINKGPEREGFTVCKRCGAAITGDKDTIPSTIKSPYRAFNNCKHDSLSIENLVLGHTFITDMLVLQIELDPCKVDTSYSSLWLKSAALSLSEALKIAASRLLDIDFSELNIGYRIRYNEKTFVDIFIYDSLSSGAGYASSMEDNLHELFAETKKLLENSCKCEVSCHSCLKNFWNKRNHKYLNRHKAMQLLNWLISGALPDTYSLDEQENLLQSLKKLLSMEDSNADIIRNNNYLTIQIFNTEKNIIVYPSMYRKDFFATEKNTLYLCDELAKNSLPIAYEELGRALTIL